MEYERGDRTSKDELLTSSVTIYRLDREYWSSFYHSLLAIPFGAISPIGARSLKGIKLVHHTIVGPKNAVARINLQHQFFPS